MRKKIKILVGCIFLLILFLVKNRTCMCFDFMFVLWLQKLLDRTERRTANFKHNNNESLIRLTGPIRFLLAKGYRILSVKVADCYQINFRVKSFSNNLTIALSKKSWYILRTMRGHQRSIITLCLQDSICVSEHYAIPVHEYVAF